MPPVLLAAAVVRGKKLSGRGSGDKILIKPLWGPDLARDHDLLVKPQLGRDPRSTA